MAITNAEELFFSLLSDVYAQEQYMAQFWDQLSGQVQDPEIRDIVSVRAYFVKQDASNIEKCFQMLGRQPTKPNVQAYQTFVDNIRREADTIQHPGVKGLYVLSQIRSMQNWRIGEYTALSAMAEYAGYPAIAALLEHNLADTVDFVERSRERFREMARNALVSRATGRAA